MSNGMFRLAACLLLELSRCKRQTELDTTLANLPNDLFGVYDRFVETVREQDLVYVTGIFRWLIYSAQSLDLAEIADALSFDFSDHACYVYDPQLQEDNVEAIPEWVEGLTTVREYDGRKTISLAHASVQDYLFSGRFTARFGYDLTQGPSHGFISHSCIRYLLYFSDHILDGNSLRSHPMAEYMARRWCHHLLRSHNLSAMFKHAVRLLEDGSPQYKTLSDLRQYRTARVQREEIKYRELGTAWVTTVSTSSKMFHPGIYPRVPPLVICSEDGYVDGARWLLDRGIAHINFRDAGGSALHAASTHNRTKIVSLLLENGIDVNAKDGRGRTALEIACAQNNTDIARLLIEHGADANAITPWFGTALQTAAWVGNEEIVELLLARGADINAHGDYFGSALQAASSRGNTEITRILLERGAECNFGGGNYGSALAAASLNGHVDPVRLLLDHGAKVEYSGYWGGFVQAAELRLNDEVERFLLANGADIRAQIPFHGSALEAACSTGRTEVVRLLLTSGVDAGTGNHALSVAAGNGDLEMVHLILDGAEVDVEAGLFTACRNGNSEIVEFLLSKGGQVTEDMLEAVSQYGHLAVLQVLLARLPAKAKTKWDHFRSALSAAVEGGQIEVIRLLLEHGAVFPRDEESLAALLDDACHNGSTQVVQLLLENGADVDGKASRFQTPLQAAAYNGKIDVCRLLIQHGAAVDSTAHAHGVDVNAQDEKHGNALTAACQSKSSDRVGIVRLLLEHGTDVKTGNPMSTVLFRDEEIADLLIKYGAQNTGQRRHGSALQEASRFGDVDLVASLLASGSDVEEEGGEDGTALRAASTFGHVQVVRLLLAHGADVNARGGREGSALQDAVQAGHTEIVRLLVQGGADMVHPNGASRSALHLASVLWGKTEMVRIMLEGGADVNTRDELGETPLYAAVSSGGTFNVLQLLLQNHADVNAQGGEYGTALRAACHLHNTAAVKLLLENGASVDMDAGEGTALHAACQVGSGRCASVLLEHGVDVNARGGVYETPLQAAAAGGSVDLVRLLLSRGADVSVQGGKYGSAMGAASTERHSEIVKILREHGAEAESSRYTKLTKSWRGFFSIPRV